MRSLVTIFLLIFVLNFNLSGTTLMNTDEGHRTHSGFSSRQRTALLPSARPKNPAVGHRRPPLRYRSRKPAGGTGHRGHKHYQADTISDARIKELTDSFKRNVVRLKTHDKLDLTFLIDESKSVGLDNFMDEVKFVSRFVSGIAVDINHTRVAVVTFADNVTSWVNQVSMGEIHAHKCSLLGRDLPSIEYVGGGTFTKGAMERAQVIFENARSESKKVIFLITDGYSNGGDPIPMSRRLKREGIEIFTFGIKEGNKIELTEIASDPKAEHTLILNSFKEFEAVARKALHSDIASGEFIVEDSSHCDKYCTESSCCHDIADCRCGTSTGRYECVCRPGYYGAGLKPDSCYPCPEGSYKPEAVPGDKKSCIPCPDSRMMSPEASTSLDQCTCAEGYFKYAMNHTARCEPITCEQFSAPPNGRFLACDTRYHASCTVTCDEGHDLEGTATVVCGGNGEWSTVDGSPRMRPFCQVRFCMSLSRPANGRLTCTDTNNAYLTACDYECDEGYRLVHGSTRICEADRHWTGADAECQEITCPNMPHPDHGVFFGACVTSERSKYGDDCSFSCPHEGFELLVAPSVTCAETGHWYPPVSNGNIKICNDTQPPELECPNDITVNTDIRKYTADVTWEDPMPVDNSESVILSPNWTFPVTLRMGVHQLSYIATDDSGLSTRCSFTVTVRDLEPPMIDNCRGPQPFVIAPGESTTHHVEWKEPTFFDNSGTVRMTMNATYGSFPLGLTVVEYVATDESGNERRCTIDIFVQDNSCPRIEEPRNGHIDCRKLDDEATECELHCNSEWYGFALVDFGRPTYVCHSDSDEWSPRATVPMDCSNQKYSSEVLKDYQVLYEMATFEHCNDTNFLESVRQIFVEIFTERIPMWCASYGSGLRCSLVSVTVKCLAVEEQFTVEEEHGDGYGYYDGYADYTDHERSRRSIRRRRQGLLDKIRRQRRDTADGGDYPEDGGYEDGYGESYPDGGGGETVPDYALGDGQGYGTEGGDYEAAEGGDYGDGASEGGLTVEESMSEIVPPSFLGEADGHTHHELEVTATLRGEIDLGGVNLDEDRRKHMGMSEFIRTLDVSPEFNGRVNNLRIPVINTTSFDYITYKQESYLTTLDEMICPVGTVFKGGAFCVNCPIGTYFDVIKSDCVSCPQGFFQDQEAQLSCHPCPSDTSTVGIHARHVEECKAMCMPGFFSPTGLQPCEACAKNMYIDFYGADACAECPDGTGTVSRASDSMEDCGELCHAGFVSKDGFTPCHACPMNSYQFLLGQTFCYECPEDTQTQHKGSDSYADCGGFLELIVTAVDPRNLTEEEVLGLEWDLDSLYYSECFAEPCENNATCKAQGSGYLCVCLAGFTGENCETNIDECEINPCAVTGTCVDLVNGFRCECAVGYESEFCEVEIDECVTAPCLNGAVCVDLLADFRCDCATGYIGTLCDVDIDECQSDPCHNGGECVDEVAGFHCTCAIGFEGVTCETNVDDCASEPCFNDAECRDGIDSFECLCKDGFRGAFCEEDIDECASDPCENNGTCLDLVNRYKCLCSPTYIGVNCEEKGDPYFDLVFNQPNTYHHIKLEYALGNLTEFTISFLMKSDHPDNYGTPFSYAVGDGVLADTLTLTDLTALTLYINGKFEVTDSRRVNDGKWYLVTVVWKSEGGEWALYLNGFPEDQGEGLAAGETISGGGVFVIGQEQDSLGGNFSSSQEFLGTISQFNVYDYAFTPRDVIRLWFNCANNEGNIRAWPDFKGGIFGTVEETNTSFCLPCSAVQSDVGYTVTELSDHAMRLACDIGYEMLHEGDDGVFRCGRDASWKVRGKDVQPELIKCTKVSCPQLGEIERGAVNVSGTYYEDNAIYSCKDGYEVIGSTRRTCQADKTWSGETPSCEDVNECADSSSCHQDANCTNSVGSYSCQCIYGFRGDGHECEEVYCVGAGSLQFGSIVGNNFKLGGVVRYSCDYGYRLEGNAERTCLKNDSWSGEIPTCVKVVCVEPKDVAHATKTPATHTEETRSYKSQMTYQCIPGYYMVGDGIRECGPDSEWTGSLPSCERVSCPQPPPVANAITIKNGGLKFGDVIEYYCEPGFSLLGDSELRCNASKMWEAPDGAYPVCEHPPCDDPPETVNGKFKISKPGLFTVTKAVYTFETEVRYECSVGYNMVGTSTLTCRDDGIWDAMRPECQIVSCGLPPAVEHAEYENSGVLYGDLADYACHPGYELEGESSLICLASGQWTDENADPAILRPACRPKNCGAPLAVPNSLQELSGTDEYLYLAIVRFSCVTGYSPSGIDTIHCGTDGVWLPEQNFQCDLVICDPPQMIGHGTFSRTQPPVSIDYEYSHTILYSCDAGFYMTGAADSQCTEHGTWSEFPPACLPIECHLPPTVNNASMAFVAGPFSKEVVYQSLLEYTCDTGFHLAYGVASRECAKDGTWTGDAPECARVSCGSAPLIGHAGMRTISLDPGSSMLLYLDQIEYNCEVGFEMAGEDIVKCGANGEFTPLPQCNPISCGEPPAVEYSTSVHYFLFGVNVFGSKVTYTCEPDFTLIGDSEITCMANGEWLVDAPTRCEPITCKELEHVPNSFRFVSTTDDVANPGLYGKGVYPPRAAAITACEDGYEIFERVAALRMADESDFTTNSIIQPKAIESLPPDKQDRIRKILKQSDTSQPAALRLDMGGSSTVHKPNTMFIQKCSEVKKIGWLRAAPECRPMLCPVPVQLEHGHFVNATQANQQPTFGTEIQYRCDTGYAFPSSNDSETMVSVTCEWSDDLWNVFLTPLPPCHPLPCHDPPLVPHSIFAATDGKETEFVYEDELQYICNEGYEMVGMAEISCEATMSWSSQPPSCPPVECPEPPAVENGRMLGKKWTFQSVISFSCNRGYRLNGAGNLTCLADRSWTSSFPTCDPVPCGSPPAVNNANVVSTSEVYGGCAVYSCKHGFYLNGYSKVRCRSSGLWEDNLPSCTYMLCPMPSLNDYVVFENTLVGRSDPASQIPRYTYDDIVTYSCEEGYETSDVDDLSAKCLTGENIPSIPSCEENEFISDVIAAHWSRPPPICTPKNCGNPPLPDRNGILNFVDFTYNSSIHYICNRGYYMDEGDDIVARCLADGSWSRDFAPVCHPVDCGQPEPVENSVFRGFAFTYQSIIQYACHEGYVLLGSGNITCRASGVWDDDLPICEPVNCGGLPKITNGKLNFEDTRLGEEAIYSCNAGYYLNGTSVFECLASGAWSYHMPPTCLPVDCGVLVKPENGFVKATGHVFTDSATYSCLPGYYLVGHNMTECQDTAEWSADPPTCHPVDCGSPPEIHNGMAAENGSTTYGTMRTYTCDSGYEPSGNMDSTCLATAEWSGLPSCVRVKCPSPEIHENGEISDGVKVLYEYEDEITYSCYQGYLAEGEVTSMCSAEKTWTHPPPSCEPIDCGSAPSVRHTHRKGWKTTFMSVFTYSCKRGYEMTGNASVECLHTGEWHPDPPECNEVSCGNPPHLKHGSIGGGDSPLSWVYEGHISYTCDVGYHLHGGSGAECSSDGTWVFDYNYYDYDTEDPDQKRSRPACELIHCNEPPALQHGSYKQKNYSYGDAVVYACDEGYDLLDSGNVICTGEQNTAEGHYIGKAPECQPVSCGSPPSIEHGSVMYSEDVYRSIANYQCDDGYNMIGSESYSHCQSTRRWSSHPVCEPKDCGPLLLPDFSSVHVTSTLYPTVLNTSCEEGYILEGATTIGCTSSGEWSSEGFHCQPVSCGHPHSIEHGYFVNKGEVFKSQVVYKCVLGHILIPNGIPEVDEAVTLACQSDGTWQDGIPSCDPVRCGTAPEIENGHRSSDDLLFYPETVDYACDSGYYMSGLHVLECSPSGEFSTAPPKCIPVSCHEPPPVRNAIGVPTGLTFEHETAYTCTYGFVLNAEDFFGETFSTVCTADGTWRPTVPEEGCIPYDCGPPLILENALVPPFTRNTTFGHLYTYQCEEGYEAAEEGMSVTCMRYGEWSKGPECLPVDCGPHTCPNHAQCTSSGTTFTNTVNVRCVAGYRFQPGVAEYNSECLASAQWSEPALKGTECSRISCGSAPDIPYSFGRSTFPPGEEYLFQSYVTYECLPGYELDGPTERLTCEADGTWGPWPYPSCIRKDCGEPPACINHADCSFESTLYMASYTVSCNAGYELEKLISTKELRCTESGEWEEPDPDQFACLQVECEVLPTVKNGRALLDKDGSTTKYLEEVGYECDPGYHTDREHSTVTCTEDRSFSDPPECLPVSCGQPDEVENGNVTSGENTFSEIASYDCDVGYILEGFRRWICSESGVWVPQAPDEELESPLARSFYREAQPLSNLQATLSEASGEESRLGEQGSGFHVVEKESKVGPEIIQRSPVAHEEVGSGFVRAEMEDIEVKARVAVMHVLSPAEAPPALDRRPFCRPVSCGSPPVVTHSEAVSDESLVFGDSVTYQCKSGFEMIGEATITCQANGQFGPNAPPRCVRVQCMIPTVNENCHISGAFPFNFETTLTYRPLLGYEFSPYTGATTITMTCQADGESSVTELPHCVAVSCGLPSFPLNGHMRADAFTYKNSATYSCDEGYELDGPDTITCLASGEWSDNAPGCRPVSCGDPPQLMLGTYTSAADAVDPFSFKQVVEYRCDEGYRFDAEMISDVYTITCQHTRLWDGSPPGCAPVPCPGLPQEDNRHSMLSGDPVYGATASFKCAAGYEMEGEAFLTCTASGEWSHAPPSCEPVSCDTPPRVTNSDQEVMPSLSYGQSVTYNCLPGYDLIGPATLTCQEDETFGHPAPVCKPIQCPNPPTLEHGRYMKDPGGFVFKSSVIYRCHDGYRMTSEEEDRQFKKITCQANRTWSGDAPDCAIISCGEPEPLTNGYVDGIRHTYMAMISYSCEAGYRVRGNSSQYGSCPDIYVCRICQANGIWGIGSSSSEPEHPICLPVSCGEPPELENGRSETDQHVYQGTTSYTCDTGYEFPANRDTAESPEHYTLNCWSNAMWGPAPVPECRRKICQRPWEIENGNFVTVYRTDLESESEDFVFGDMITYYCDVGYYASANVTLTCGSDKLWDSEPPVCEPVSCGPPPNRTNGYILMADHLISTTYGAFFAYICDVGHEYLGEEVDNIIICTADGVWSKSEPPPCTPVHCEEPAAIDHGSFLFDSLETSYLGVVQYTCDEGYELQGEGAAICFANKLWSSDAPECTPVPCPAPPMIAHGHPDIVPANPQYVYRDMVAYACETGYRLGLEASYADCSANGTWMNLPECNLVTCDALLPRENSHREGGAASYQEKISYICEEGYALESGQSSIECICGPEGHFSAVSEDYETETCKDTLPECVRVSCGGAPSIIHGIVKNGQEEYFFQDIVTYGCEEGHLIKGNADVRCNANRQFDHLLPFCVRVSCGTPPPVDNAVVIVHNGTKFADVISYECLPGYLSTGQTTNRKCLSSGQWSDDCVRCDPVNCTEVEQPLNGWMSSAGSIAFGSSRTFGCDTGFELIGNEVLLCEASGNWSSSIPVCERIVCDEFPNVANGVPIGDMTQLRYEDEVDFMCNEGHIMAGVAVITCLANGTWTTPPTCDPVKCLEIVPVQNAVIENDQHGYFTYGQRVSYVCNPGYQLATEDHERVCQADGSFSNVDIFCELIPCPRAPSVENGAPSVLDVVYGQNVTYSCDDGYRMVGFKTIRCGVRGTWTDPPPLCVRVSCGSAPEVRSAYIADEKANYVYGDVVEYTCFPGYHLESGAWRECLASKEFDDNVACLPVECDELPLIENAVMILDGTTYMSEAIISCMSGYVLSSGNEDEHLICQEDKTWTKDPSQIECIPVACPELLNLNNGHTSITHSPMNPTLNGERQPSDGHLHVFGAQAEFSCNHGYILEGSSIATCGDDGEWSQPTPTCVAVLCGVPPPVDDAVPIESSFTYGMIAEYQCIEGHRFTTEAKSHVCQADRSFSMEEIACSPIPCPAIPPTQHGMVATEEAHYGDVTSYICDIGYESVSVATCLKTGHWDLALQPCEPISCGSPPNYANARIKSEENFVFGSSAEYVCEAGYALADSSRYFSVPCTSDGLFSEPELPCEQITCNLDHPEFHNKHILHTSGVAVAGDLLSVTCEEGYLPIGEDEVYCNEDGEWLFSDVECVIVKCGLAPKVPDATPVLAQDYVYVYHSTVKYTCNPGYQLSDAESVVTCQSDGSFEANTVFCDPVMCQDTSVIQHGSKSSSVTSFGEKIVMTCDTGYELETGGHEFSVTCLDAGEWSHDISDILCLPVVCEPLQDLEFGTILMDDAVMNDDGALVYDSSIRYKCSRGYTLKGVAKHSCLPDGSWTGTLPECIPVQCGPPPFFPHGSIGGDGMWTYGSEITYTCDLGYNLTPEQSIHRFCNDMGSWTGAHPSCAIISCGRPEPLLHGSIDFYSVTYGSEIEINCNEGYNQTVGEPERICQADGTYSGEEPVCERITCGIHPYVEHANVSHTEVAYYGDQVDITCDDGFEMFGDATRFCESEGLWTGIPPECVTIASPARLKFLPKDPYDLPCGPPPPLNSTKVQLVEGIDLKDEYYDGEEVEYCCARGYVPAGAMTRTCQNGIWTEEPLCIAICRYKCRQGRCVAKDRCSCNHGWSGSQCHEPVCNLPCLNGGYCTRPFLCACKSGWTGSRCHKPVCTKPCQNGGRCAGPNICQCPYGYGGVDCGNSFFSFW